MNKIEGNMGNEESKYIAHLKYKVIATYFIFMHPILEVCLFDFTSSASSAESFSLSSRNFPHIAFLISSVQVSACRRVKVM